MSEERDLWTARLSAYVDGDLPTENRAELERHLVGCAECRAAIADLRRIRDLATTLVDGDPPRDLWPGIGARIGAAPGRGGVLPFRRRWAFTVPQLAAAAALLLAVGAGGAALALGGIRAGRPGRGMVVEAPPSVGVAPVAFSGSASLAQATASLERLLADHRERLDSGTVRVLEQSLRVIDRAIAEAQAALTANPSDPYLNAHLADTMRRKVTLLRRAAALLAAS